ncbi:serine/threonine protein kinase, partial [candidate division KSB1 bacterium]|nr:serine/threonine protein kinase [candidate division KSB1 bacterium]NIR72588.1 serine/threonine protein kinase [candidate division KSB1 bacterium]NIS23648.1 serine/threonine protein kinase [candidate division KSB1 bacterium]NIT70572.1 serine/threonine protein kinase [candidate division KSB1 bacterium]NIU24290.1 serine/threonine protein kinase [candidate division KSB1 bacterium]
MKNIGKYQVLEELGKGGMGVVYKAYDPIIEREVAIKVILERALEIPEVRDRFYREAKSAGRLTHENLTVVHDVGESEGSPFIVMEYLSGTDLRDLIKSHRPLTLAKKLDIVLQICNGLAKAHQHNIIHRDIKPENIKILDDGKVKVMDFGIAKPEASTLTETGMRLGTPYYMSPEQIKGKRVNKQTDIFSFGVLLYELLTYKKPFVGETAESVMYNIVHEQPERMALEDTALADDLQNIVSKCLEKETEKRYKNFSEVIRDLDKVVTKETTPQKKPKKQAPTRTLTVGEVQTIDLSESTGKRPSKVVVPVLLLVVMIGSVAGWLIYRNDLKNGQANFTDEASDARQTMLTSKSNAQAANADELAAGLFTQAVEAEKQADEEFADGNYLASRDGYIQASNQFKLAIEEARQNVELADSEKQESNENLDPVQKEEPVDDSSARLAANTNSPDIPKDTSDKPKENEPTQRLKKNVQDARASMLDAKDAVPGTAQDKTSDSSYQEAKRLETRAENQLQNSQLELALPLFRDARDFYLKSESSITATLRNRAETAKQEMQTAKDQIAEDSFQEEKYQQGLQRERVADRAYNSQNYVTAYENYKAAKGLFDEIVSAKENRERRLRQAIDRLR